MLGPYYNRIVIVMASCWCGAQRGQPCRGTHRKAVNDSWVHADRRVAADYQRRKHPEVYRKLRDQVEIASLMSELSNIMKKLGGKVNESHR